MKTHGKLWLTAVIVGLFSFVLCALTLRNSYLLTSITDLIEGLLLASGAAAFLPLALRSNGRIRLFWSLMTAGIFLWLSYQMLWIYFEVVLRQQVPDLFAGDAILFLNIVPMMAALALRPHKARDEYSGRMGRLDFLLLLVWWFYLYVLMVIPWQYVVIDVETYNRNLNTVYSIEKFAFLAGLAACWAGTTGKWRKLYVSLFGMSLSYSASSALANWAIARGAYYSGSFYDIPMACAMAWLTWIGLNTQREELAPGTDEWSTVYGIWVARAGMIAVFSLPLFATWAITDTSVPPRVRVFRLAATLFAAFVLGLVVFFRQYWLERELVHLLKDSRESFSSLKLLQTQILQSEKLASVGQLVGGAAHELNNPITAMLGYSDLLSNTQLTAEQQIFARKIGQDVRRTRSLVASLISFARQGPSAKAPVDLNTLVRTAIKLIQPQYQSPKLAVEADLDPELPRVLGDSNRLLQVCMQLLGNCIHSMAGRGDVLTVRSRREGPIARLEFSAIRERAEGNFELEGTREEAHGLSACQGILREHGGAIVREQSQDGRLRFQVDLPISEIIPAIKDHSRSTVLRQSQPFA